MSETIKEWITKAEGDYRVAGRELKEAEDPNHDAICFHSQQGVEKLMKATLIQAGTIPPKVHDLVALGRLIADVHENWSWPLEELRFLSLSSVSFRYPGESAEPEDAKKAFEICSRIRDRLLSLLNRE